MVDHNAREVRDFESWCSSALRFAISPYAVTSIKHVTFAVGIRLFIIEWCKLNVKARLHSVNKLLSGNNDTRKCSI